MNKEISQTITALRFPICAMVVFIHSTVGNVNLNGESINAKGGYYNIVHDLFSYGFCASAVPLFFFIAGYLYFLGCSNGFHKGEYISKSKKRVKSLLLPYIVWNIYLLILFYCVQNILPTMLSGSHKAIMDYKLMDFILAFWDAGEGFPINGPMWFIRDLIVFSALSPIAYIFVRNRRVGLVVCIVMMVFNVKGAYFVMGAWCMLHGIDFAKLSRQVWPYTVLLWLVLVVLSFHQDTGNYAWLKVLYVFIGTVALTGIISRIYYKREVGEFMIFLSSTSFFIFAFHQQPLLILCKLWAKYLPNSEPMLIAGYFILPLLIISISIGLYLLMRMICPKILSFINGGR